MKKNKEIELSSIEATAYWWINVIRSKVRELVISGTTDKNEIEFVEKFYYNTERDWRNLYLKLVNYITEDVNNYVSIGHIIGIDAFNQDTAKNGHNRINTELSKIMNCSIPDIRLASSFAKDSVIYTNMFGTCILYKSCGLTDLSTKYDSTYVLTGDEQELDFYNLIISIIVVLKKNDENFSSTPQLRSIFCREYKKNNKLHDDLEELTERFNCVFKRISDKGIILGCFWEENYFCHFCDIDFVGLEQYMETAEHYANVILNETKSRKKKLLKLDKVLLTNE